MKKVGYLIIFIILSSSRLLSQNLVVQDFLISTPYEMGNPLAINIPKDLITDFLTSKSYTFNYLEVKIDLVSTYNDNYFIIDNLNQPTYTLVIYDSPPPTDYAYVMHIYHGSPINGDDGGYYPSKYGVKYDYIKLHYKDSQGVSGEEVLLSSEQSETYNYMYWNKSCIDFRMKLSNNVAGKTVTAETHKGNYIYDIENNSDYEISYIWNVIIGSNYVYQNIKTDKSSIKLDIPEDATGIVQFNNYMEITDKSGTQCNISNSIDILPWYDGINFDLTSNNMQICNGNLSTFNLNYTDNEIPDHVGYTWQVSDNLQIISSTRVSLTVKANSTSRGIAYVILNLDGVPHIYSEDMWVGKPNFTLTPIDYVMHTMEPGFTSIDYYGSTNYIIQGVNSVDWSSTGPIMKINGDFTKARFTTDRREGMGYIYADVRNTCGSTENSVFFEVEDRFVMYGPNPADEEIVISLDSTESLQSYSTNKENVDSNEEITTIILYDQNSNIIFNDKLSDKKKEVKWNTSSLKNGTYFLQINKKNKKIKKQIIIEHN